MLQCSSRGGLPGPGGVSAWSGGVLLGPGGVLLGPEGGFSGEHAPVNRITDTCKNITLATTSLRPVTMGKKPYCVLHRILILKRHSNRDYYNLNLHGLSCGDFVFAILVDSIRIATNLRSIAFSIV